MKTMKIYLIIQYLDNEIGLKTFDNLKKAKEYFNQLINRENYQTFMIHERKYTFLSWCGKFGILELIKSDVTIKEKSLMTTQRIED